MKDKDYWFRKWNQRQLAARGSAHLDSVSGPVTLRDEATKKPVLATPFGLPPG